MWFTPPVSSQGDEGADHLGIPSLKPMHTTHALSLHSRGDGADDDDDGGASTRSGAGLATATTTTTAANTAARSGDPAPPNATLPTQLPERSTPPPPPSIVCVRDLEISVRHFFASIDVDEAIALGGTLASFSRAVGEASQPTRAGGEPTQGASDRSEAGYATTEHGPPLFIERFSIAPVRVTVSARASVQVYLSVDDAVLQFGAIDSSAVLCFPANSVWQAVGERCVIAVHF